MSCTRGAGAAVDRLLFAEAELLFVAAAPAGVDARQVAPYRMVHVDDPLL
jgi:hypothetical protein